MGALHRGHIALVRQARKRARRVVVSIFVNPAQFAPSEDFASYPRDFAADIAALAAEKVDLVWAPSADVMYPRGLRHPHHAGRRGHSRARRQIPSAFLRRRHDRGGQAVHASTAGLRHVRRKGLPAIARRHADGEGSRSGREGDRRADGTRAGRFGAVVAQRLSQRNRAGSRRRRFIACSRPAPPTSRRGEPIESVLVAGARQNRASPASRSIISRRATP